MRRLAQKLMDVARGRGVPFADVRLRRSVGTSVFLQDGRVEQASSGSSAGAGIRVLVDGAWGLSCVDSLELNDLLPALDEAASQAREASREGRRTAEVARPGRVEYEVGETPDFSPLPSGLEKKAKGLLALEQAGRRAVPSGKMVNSALAYADGEATEVVASTFGTAVVQHIYRASCACTMVARDNGRTESWTEKVAAPSRVDLLSDIQPEEFSVKAAREALLQTRCASPPGGMMPVVFDPSMTGLFIHECLGHGAEADQVLMGHSILAGRVGEQIGSPKLTVIDDPTLPLAFGAYRYDSEGVPAEPVTLLEKGVLKNFLHSLETASRMGHPPNGHGRSEGVLARPIPRMSNTYLAPGEDDFEEMIRGIERGVLVVHGTSGYAMVERGQYTCHADRGIRIEHGRLGEPVRHVSLNGEVIDTLKKTDRVGRELRLCDPGYCSKDGQDVPVDNGGPYVRVSELLVGGRGER